MKTFDSLEELNEFLVSKGMEPISPNDVPDFDGAVGFRVRKVDEEIGPSDLDLYIDFSTRQLEHVMAQRDEARKLYEHELEAHVTCHDKIDDVITKVRAQGYAEAVAAGLYPGTPFERLPADQQETLMRRAYASIAQIDDIRQTMMANDAVNRASGDSSVH